MYGPPPTQNRTGGFPRKSNLGVCGVCRRPMKVSDGDTGKSNSKSTQHTHWVLPGATILLSYTFNSLLSSHLIFNHSLFLSTFFAFPLFCFLLFLSFVNVVSRVYPFSRLARRSHFGSIHQFPSLHPSHAISFIIFSLSTSGSSFDAKHMLTLFSIRTRCAHGNG